MRPQTPDVSQPVLLRVDDDADARRLRAAVVAAALVHAALLTLTLPALEPRAAAPKEVRPVFVVRTPVFRRPPVTPEVPVEAPVRRVPVPDPTPDDPEPIRDLIVEEIVLPMPAADVIPIPDAPPPAADPGPYVVGGAVSAPVKRFAPPPLYPELARRARREGLVIVQAVIDREGRVVRARVVKDEPFGLTEAALAAVERWRFEPGRLDGEPVDVLFNLRVDFRLR